jgi:hypothetical protein
VIVFAATETSAQQSTPPAGKALAQPIGGFAQNLPTPTSPALVILNVAPDKSVQPTSLSTLATSLVNGVDRDGRLQAGVAVDVTPYMVWGAKHVTHGTYLNSLFVRIAARTTLSAAITKAAAQGSSSLDSASKAVQAAFGVSVTLIDLGDRRASPSLASCLVAAADFKGTPPFAIPPPMDPTVGPEALKAQVEAAQKKAQEAADKIDATLVKGATADCRNDANKRLWNRSAVAVGFAQTWRSGTGLAHDLADGGHASWISGAYGFEGLNALRSFAQAVVYLQQQTGTLVKADSGSATSLGQTTVGFRFRFGTGSTAGSIDESRIVKDTVNSSSTKWSTAVSLHQHISGDVWITLSAGAEARAGLQGRQVFVLNSLSWGYGAK